MWLAFAPIFLQGIVLVYALRPIQTEIEFLQLKPYYNTGTIIYTHFLLWFTLLVFLVIWCAVAGIGFYPVLNDTKSGWVFLLSFRVIETTVLALKLGINLLILFMLVQFSKPQGLRLFDKVVKQKFLILFEEMHTMSRETKESVRINLTRYLLRLEGAVMKETAKQLESLNDMKSNVSSVDDKTVVCNSIVNKSIITIFMAFLTYQPFERRDFL